MEVERRSAEVTLRSVNRDERTIDFIASTPSKDSYGTRIDQNGWDLEQFRRNPVMTWAHDDRGYTPSGGRPIAKGEDIRVEDGKLRVKARFPKKGVFQFADEVFELAADGFINAVSVGFEPIESEIIDEGGEPVRIFRKQRLLEVAIVTIPSNDDALAQRAKTLNRNEEEIRQRVEKLEQLATEPEIDPEEHEKYRSYFEQKQPVNKAAGKVLKKWYEDRGEKPPADEKEAWENMLSRMDSPIQPAQKAEEAPPPVQKTSVLLTPTQLNEVVNAISDACVRAAVEASRRGVPLKELDSFMDSLGNTLKDQIIPKL
jgi:HK97 family phage prohead protease